MRRDLCHQSCCCRTDRLSLPHPTVRHGQMPYAVAQAANWVFSAKSACVHPERKEPYLCGDCPRNGKVLNANREVCATAALVSSAKSACIHPDRKDPYLWRLPAESEDGRSSCVGVV
eukprot:Skav208883  [mRNA]  locus=scaffold270:252528:254389:- [translate_table: standard]